MPRLLTLLLVTLLVSPSLWARLDYRSPDVGEDGKVTFKLHAPNAEVVTLRGVKDVKPTAMAKGAGGIWATTIGPLDPEVYSYYFLVDGARVLDPRNRNTKDWLLMESAFEVTGDGRRSFAVRDVPHGVVHQHTYTSAVRGGASTNFLVYTPPGYDPRSDRTYPVIFLQHGFGDDERAWVDFGRANFTADNLIAAGKAKPALIVMTHGHPEPLPYGNPNRPDYGMVNHQKMERQVVDEILPQVESNYRAKTSRQDRAIVGLSMGGGHALGIGSENLDTFGWVGGFSSGVQDSGFDQFFRGLKTAHQKSENEPKLLWIACGEDDFLLERNQVFIAWLEDEEIPHTWMLTTGNHSWPVWRDYWAQFYPLLF